MDYQLVGYISDLSPFEFVFISPVFRFGDKLYRRATKKFKTDYFYQFNGTYIPIKDGGKFRAGDPAIFMFMYRGKLFIGTAEEISPKLMELFNLNNEEFSPLCKYDIGSFFEDEKMVVDSLNSYIASKDNPLGLKLALKNFVKPSDLTN